MTVFRLYTQASPQDAYAYLGLGKACEGTGDKTGAVTAYRQYLAIEPDDPEIKSKLGMLELSMDGNSSVPRR